MYEPREGDWTCRDHGTVTPRTDTIVPSCPDCGGAALEAIRSPGRSYLVYAEPAPARCVNGHQFGPGKVHLGWHACNCLPALVIGHSGHATWRCMTCGNTQQWPPCHA